MNRNLYVLLTLFLGLFVASSILNSIINLQLGAEIFTLDSYILWFVVANITATIGSILLLKYYYYRNYRFAFFTGIVASIANFVFASIVYIILTSGELRGYYLPVLLVLLCINIVYAVGLVFSDTQERFWLKLSGVCIFVLGVILVSILVAIMHVHVAQTNLILQKIGQWISMAIGLVPVLYIMNFLSEIRALNTESKPAPAQKILESIFGFAGIIALIFTISLGTLLISDSYSKSYWKNYNAEQAQDLVKQAGGARTFVGCKQDTLHYLLIKPQEYDPQKKYPLVVCLPYGGYEAAAAELLSTDVNRKAYSAFIFVPYCVEGTGWGGIPGTPNRDSLVYAAINALAEPGIDIKRRYVTGISRGGYGAWQFICMRPDMFAAAIPVSGGGDPKFASKTVNVAVWAFHGAKDRNVPVIGSRDMIAAIKKAGGNPKYTEFQNEGHNIWDQVSKTPGLLDWLFAQKQE